MEGRADRALLLGICPPILSAEDRRRAWAQLSLPKPRTGPETASQACCKCPPRVMRRWVPPVWKRQVRGQVCACPSLRPAAPRVIFIIASLEKGAPPAGCFSVARVSASGTCSVLEKRGRAHGSVSGGRCPGRGRRRLAARASQSVPPPAARPSFGATRWGQVSALGRAPVAGFTVALLAILRRSRRRCLWEVVTALNHLIR